MPDTPLKNHLYRLGLILAAPSVATQQVLFRYRPDETLPLSPDYGPGRLFKRHHMLGGTLLLDDGAICTQICSSLKTSPKRTVTPATVFRVASITKMATALCILRLREQGYFQLTDTLFSLLPCSLPSDHPLRSATLEQVLSHRSGLRDTPAYEQVFRNGGSYDEVLQSEGVHGSRPGETFAYCNFGFGLLGSLIEQVTGVSLEEVYQREVFQPLNMRATLDLTQAPTAEVLPISRVFPYHPRQSWKPEIPRQMQPLTHADPARHFGYAAGSMYTDAVSLDNLLTMLAQGGQWQDMIYLPAEAVAEMTAVHAAYGEASPTLSYGLGLLMINDPAISSHTLFGHQGFAYGCADGAFFEEGTGRRVVLLNGGASEARTGRLGTFNRDILRWAMREDNDAWT